MLVSRKLVLLLHRMYGKLANVAFPFPSKTFAHEGKKRRDDTVHEVVATHI